MIRKEELEKRIDYLENCKLWADLKPEEQTELSRSQLSLNDILRIERLQSEKKAQELSKEMRRRRNRGRYGEKKLAKEVGGRRDGGVGRKDVISGMFSYEIKTIKEIPASIIKIMAQAERLKKQGTVAVGVFRCNSPRQEYFIVEKNDWLSLHGKR